MSIHLFMGQEFEHGHEMRALRQFLENMQKRFGTSDQYYFVFVNYFIGGKEIDLTVLKKNAIIVIELKECGDNSISGAENGDWVIHNIDGSEAIINPDRENPFQQARKYRSVWITLLNKRNRDFLSAQKASQMNFGHVSAFVALSPRLHLSSQIDIDFAHMPWFKVAGLDKLCEAVYDQRSPKLSFTAKELTTLAEDILRLKWAEIEEFLQTCPPTAPPTGVPREAPVSDEQWRGYCQSLANDHADWTELFVLPEALKFVPARLIPVEKTGLFPPMPHLRDVMPTPQPVPVAALDYVRWCENPLVILGDPGQGKTAAVEQLTVEYARRRLEETEELVPVLVKLNMYNPQQRDLRNLIAISLRSRGLQIDAPQIEQLLGSTTPPLLLMFDGLDEVKVADSTNVKQDLEWLLMKYPAHKYIITCRKADYSRFALRIEGEETAELRHFEEKDVRRFLIDYYWYYEQNPSKGGLLFGQLEQQGLLNLAQTPLHLGLIVRIAEETGELPANRGELYQRFVDEALELERRKGTISPEEWRRIERFLAHLALVMHERETLRIGESEARGAINQYWQELKGTDKFSWPRDQIFDGVWNSRLLMRTGEEAHFRHSVLQDYFVAKRLAYMLEDADEMDAIYRYVGVPRWDEVFVLLAGIMDDASGLLQTISEKAFPLLALRCLASARKVDEWNRMVTVERILDRLFDPEILAQQFEGFLSTLPSIASHKELMAYLASNWTKRILSSDTISQNLIFLYGLYGGWLVEAELLAALENSDEENERLRSVDLLVYLGTEKSVEPLVTCLEEENPDLRFPAILALGRIGDPKAIEALKPCLFDSDSDVRCIAITALGSLCGADVWPPPKDFLSALMPIVPRQEPDSAEVEEIKKLLRFTLSDSSEAVRTEAAIVLGCLGETQVVDQLAEILMDAEFDYYKKGRVARALGYIGTEEAVGALGEFNNNALFGGVLVPKVVLDVTHPDRAFPDIGWTGSPVWFEICAGCALNEDTWGITRLVDIVSDWKGRLRATTDEEAGDQSTFIQMYRWNRLRWYGEKVEPAIIAMGAKAVVPLLECISEAEESTRAGLVEEESHRLLEEIRKAIKVEELVKLLTEASQISEEVEGAIYLLGEAYTGAEDPLLNALKESEKLVDLFIEAYQKSEWRAVLRAAVQALARFARAVGKDTAMGAKVYHQVVEPSVEDLGTEEGYKRQKAFYTLACFGEPQAAGWLLETLNDEDDQRRYWSALFLLTFYADYADEQVIDTAIEALRKATDPAMRKGIALKLKELDHPKVIAAFGDALQDPEWWVRWTAAKVLHDKGDQPSVGALIQALDDEDSFIRHEVIRALGKIGDPRTVGTLTDILWYHEDKDTRQCAAAALEEIGDPAATEAFVRALRDENADVRCQAAKALGELGDASVAPSLVAALTDPEPEVRSKAAKALGELGDASVVPWLVEALTDSEAEVQRAAVHATGKIGELETVKPLLIEILETGSPNVQYWAAITLACLKDSSAVELCVQALDCTETGIRKEALDALVSAGTELLDANRLLKLCTDMLEDEDESVRWHAVLGLAKVATPEAISLLRGILDSAGETPYMMRVGAVSSLANIGTPEAVGAIIEALDDPDEFVRFIAVVGLRKIGDATALPALTRVAKEDTGPCGDVSLADAAREAIEQIQKRCGK